MNQVRIEDYFRCIREHLFPVMRGFHYTPTDLRLHLLFQELQGLAVDRVAYQQLFGLDVVEEHASVWDAFRDLGWAAVSDDRVTVCGDGVFYLPLLQNALGHDRLRQMRQSQRATTVSVPEPRPVLAAPATPAVPTSA
jgi:oxygen-independent coproporphyrinogen-3 oxidase